jgi:hypothetical protein
VMCNHSCARSFQERTRIIDSVTTTSCSVRQVHTRPSSRDAAAKTAAVVLTCGFALFEETRLRAGSMRVDPAPSGTRLRTVSCSKYAILIDVRTSRDFMRSSNEGMSVPPQFIFQTIYCKFQYDSFHSTIRNAQYFQVEIQKERNHSRGLHVDDKILTAALATYVSTAGISCPAATSGSSRRTLLHGVSSFRVLQSLL